MKNLPAINQISNIINDNLQDNHIIILPRNISTKLVRKLIKINCEDNYAVKYLDEYIFELHEINKKNLAIKDIKYLEKILSETDSFFNEYNLTQETENIVNILNEICLEKNLYVENKKIQTENIIKKFNSILLSYESKIIFEILSIWLTRSKSSDTYINKYLFFLNNEGPIKSIKGINAHIIEFDKFANLEKKWLENNFPKFYQYKKYTTNLNINKDDFAPNNLKKYSTSDFNTHEEELEFLASNISSDYNKNKSCKIALINNDRYFARRLRALLARQNIKINDNSGWLLSTSTCCAYINSILNYFIHNPNYIDLFDIIMSPYFMSHIQINVKHEYLNSIYAGLKNNINTSLENFQHKDNLNITEYKIFDNLFIDNNPSKYKNDKPIIFNEFKKFLENKIEKFNSKKLIINDEAGKEFYEVMDYMDAINKNSTNKFALSIWHKKLVRYLENKSFYSKKEESNIYYTDINHSLLFEFDKIYVSSMSEKNYPKKIINHFSINNSVYSDYSINSNKEQIENIEDFLNLSNNSSQIILTSHFSNNDEVYSKSRFKRYVDHYLTNKTTSIKKIVSKKDDKIESLTLDNSFAKLSYKDIENYNNCYYCFYFEKKSPKRSLTKISSNHAIFGSFAHSVLDLFIKKYKLKSNKLSAIDALEEATLIAEGKFFLKNEMPYEIQLWKNLLPSIAEYFSLNLDKKYNFKSENYLSIVYNNMKFTGRYDLSYSLGNENYVVDYKTGSIIPTRKSVTEGQLLQLPFYTILNPNITTALYMLLNIYTQNITYNSFSKDELEESRNIIYRTADIIKKDITNNNLLIVEKSLAGCQKCGYQDINRPIY